MKWLNNLTRTEKIVIVLFIITFTLLLLSSCNKPNKYVITTSTSVDTVTHYNILPNTGWIYYHQEDGSTVYEYNAKIDTIN